MTTKTSKTIKACTFDNIQCLRLLKASGAKYSCITQTNRKTIIGLGPGLRFYILGYGSYTRILHENQTQMQMLRSTICRNEEVALHRSVMSLPIKLRPRMPPTLPTPAHIKTNTLKKKTAAHIFTFNSETDH